MPCRCGGARTEMAAAQVALGERARDGLGLQLGVRSLGQAAQELVANAIDARARTVRVQLKAARDAGLRVTDDGVGVPAEQMARVGERHWSSKGGGGGDGGAHPLAAAASAPSLGHRGEALWCISRCSARVEVTSRAAGAPEATRKVWQAGRVISCCAAPAPPELGEAQQHSSTTSSSSSIRSGTCVDVTGFTAPTTAALVQMGRQQGVISSGAPTVRCGARLHASHPRPPAPAAPQATSSSSFPCRGSACPQLPHAPARVHAPAAVPDAALHRRGADRDQPPGRHAARPAAGDLKPEASSAVVLPCPCTQGDCCLRQCAPWPARTRAPRARCSACCRTGAQLARAGAAPAHGGLHAGGPGRRWRGRSGPAAAAAAAAAVVVDAAVV